MTNDQPSLSTRPNGARGRRLGRLARALGAGDRLPIDPDLAPDDVATPSPTHRAGGPRERRARPAVLAAIGAGGFVGTLSRYELELAWPTAAGHFPAATFTINTSGAFLLGLFVAVAVERRRPTAYLRPFAATGLLGGWTTYSTLAVDADTLCKAGDPLTACAYLAVTVAAGLAAVALGIALGRARTATRGPGVPAEAADGGEVRR